MFRGLSSRIFGTAKEGVDTPTSDPVGLATSAPRIAFMSAAAALGADARVLEIGTKQSIEGRPTHLQTLFPQVLRQNYLMSDVEAGADVDVVTDLHALPDAWIGRFQAVVANAVFEHLERPWIAAQEVARVLAPNGFCFVSTHQTFPLHGYPSDYFRFSREALSLILRDAGLTVCEAGYEYRAKIAPPPSYLDAKAHDGWNAVYPSYIVVNTFARKPA